MESLLVFVGLFSLASIIVNYLVIPRNWLATCNWCTKYKFHFATNTEARKDPSENWKGAMKHQRMPELVQHIIDVSKVTSVFDKKSHCHSSTESLNFDRKPNVSHHEKKKFRTKDIEPRPNISAYDDDSALKEVKHVTEDSTFIKDAKPNQEKSFAKGFEPRSAYTDDKRLKRNKESFAEDFEPRPNISAYSDDEKLKDNFKKDFEPRPNISAYTNDEKLKGDEKSFTEDFEPRPNISAYIDEEKLKEDDKSFTEDFEPRPNISAYTDHEKLKGDEKSFMEDFKPRPNISAYDDNVVGGQVKKASEKDFEPPPNISVYHE